LAQSGCDWRKKDDCMCEEPRMRTLMLLAILAGIAHAESPTPITPAMPPQPARAPTMPKPIAAPNPSLSAEFKKAHAGETVAGVYRICVDTEGKVWDVVATESIPDADSGIIDHIKKNWRYEKTPVRICGKRRFIFKIPEV
jgi:hypothetical protein